MRKNYTTRKNTLFVLLLIALIPNCVLANKPILRLLLTTTNFNDETVFYFEQGGTTSFQSAFDAYKLLSNPGTVPYIGSMSDSILTGINGLPELPSALTIPVKAITPATRTFTFSTDISEFNSFVCVTLFDSFTGISTNILTSDYVCTLYDTTSIARFTLNFFTTSLNASGILTQPSCLFPTGGKITANSSGSGLWNYEWRKGDTIVRTTTVQSGVDSLDNLSSGLYSVRVNGIGTCSYFTNTFTIDSIILPTSSFSSTSFNTGLVNFVSSSANSQFSTWDFGDNSGVSNVINPSHHYLAPGIYQVSLITESSTFCKDTLKKRIEVFLKLTDLDSYERNDVIALFTLPDHHYRLSSQFQGFTSTKILLMDLNGLALTERIIPEVKALDYTIDLNAYAAGIYLLHVSNSQGFQKTFKILR